VPLDLAIRETSDDGRPITVSDPGSPHAQLFREIAAKVWSKVSGEGSGRVPPRIVVE
jgi:ATP-binding protein involved in chromosome partitioning